MIFLIKELHIQVIINIKSEMHFNSIKILILQKQLIIMHHTIVKTFKIYYLLLQPMN